MKNYEIKYLEISCLMNSKKVESQLAQAKTYNFGADRPIGNSIGELSTYDNHPADLGTETF